MDRPITRILGYQSDLRPMPLEPLKGRLPIYHRYYDVAIICRNLLANDH